MRSKHQLILILCVCISLSASLKAQQTTGNKQQENTDTTLPASTIVQEESNRAFAKPEVQVSVDIKLWRRHLESHLGQPIIKAMKAGMQPGKYTVNIRFIVEKDGSIADVKALNDPGYGLAESAIKVVQTGPKWSAAEQGGQKVRSYYTQPISFFIQPTKYTQM